MFPLFLLFATIQSLKFGYNMKPYEYKCFTDSLPHNELYQFKAIGSSALYILKIEYTEKMNNKIVYQREKVTSHFYHDMIVDYHYTVSFCFKNLQENPLNIEIDYLTGAEILDQEQIAKVEDIENFNRELEILEHANKDMVREKEYILQQEKARFDGTHDISNKIVSLSLFSMGVFFVVSYCSLHQIRKVFERKKVQ